MNPFPSSPRTGRLLRLNPQGLGLQRATDGERVTIQNPGSVSHVIFFGWRAPAEDGADRTCMGVDPRVYVQPPHHCHQLHALEGLSPPTGCRTGLQRRPNVTRTNILMGCAASAIRGAWGLPKTRPKRFLTQNLAHKKSCLNNRPLAMPTQSPAPPPSLPLAKWLKSRSLIMITWLFPHGIRTVLLVSPSAGS